MAPMVLKNGPVISWWSCRNSEGTTLRITTSPRQAMKIGRKMQKAPNQNGPK